MGKPYVYRAAFRQKGSEEYYFTALLTANITQHRLVVQTEYIMTKAH